MYRHLLLPVDLSDKNDLAVQTVQQLSAGPGTVVTLLHVIETLRDLPFEEMEDFYRELGEQAERSLTRWSTMLSGAGFDVRQEIVYGQRSQEIIRTAVAQGADLIVMRSHVLDRQHPAESFGTLSHQVALLAPCSVLLVR